MPGVTAACAAAASLGESLTDRGQIDTLVLTTGHREQGYRVPDAIADLRPGTCVALYMAVGAAPQIMDQFERDHPDEAFEVQVVAKAQRQGQITLTCPISQLAVALKTNGITGEAMLMVRRPSTNQQATVIQQPFVAIRS